MTLPTLLLKGNLEYTGYGLSQKKLNDLIPIEYIMEFFEQRMGKPGITIADKIIILKSSTGSGKSTLLPPEFYHRFFDNRSIACTQPRVFNAKDLPRNIIPYHTADKLKDGRTPLEMGKNIGYQTQYFIRKPIRGINYMTVGILQAQLTNNTYDEIMNKYSAIFIDEVHERSVDIDSTLFMLKKLIRKNYTDPRCPFLIIMSATLDTKMFCDYMLSDIAAPKRYENIISVSGSTFPIEDIWLDYDASDINVGALSILKKLHKDYAADFSPDFAPNGRPVSLNYYTFRDVVIFVPGASHGDKLTSGIMQLNYKDDFFKKYPCMPLFISGESVEMETEEYLNVFRDINDLYMEIEGKKVPVARRIILATPTMETGVTIETLKHVIELGLIKQAEYNPSLRIETLVTKPVTRDIARQRRGRVGRKYEGVCWYAYTEDTMNSMTEHPNPSIIENKIDNDLLSILYKLSDPDNICNNYTLRQLLENDFFKTIMNQNIDIRDIDMFTLPTIDALHSALEKLFVIGAIDSNSSITALGLMVLKLSSLDIEMIKFIYIGYIFNVSICDLITIVSIQQVKAGNIFADSKQTILKRSIREGAFNILKGHDNLMWEILIADDFIYSLVYFNEFIRAFNSGKNVKKWCAENGLKYNGFIKIISKRDDIIFRMAECGLNPFHSNEFALINCTHPTLLLKQVKRIKRCIFEAYKLNIASRDGDYYRCIKTNFKFKLRQDILTDYKAEYIVFDKLFGLVNPKTNMYEYFPTSVSILDGYVPLDIYYDSLL